MKTRVYLLLIIFYPPFNLLAQDSLVLSCPLNEKLESPVEKKSYSIGAADLKAVWISKTDTTVKACTNGMITVILHDADGKWEAMFSHDVFTFWYSGLSGLTVVKGQKIKNGETIGYTKKTEKITLQMMDAETSVDPKEFLDCKR
jgi:Peptidase family M23